MTTDEFLRILGETGAYETPAAARRRPLPSWLATPLFQVGMLRVYASFLRACRRPGFDKLAIARHSYMVFSLVERLGGTVHMEGFRALDSLGGGPAVVVVNHVSALETYLMPGSLAPWGPMTFVLKRSLLSYPFIGPGLRAMDPIPVDRKSPVADLRAVLTEGKRLLGTGRFVVLFPQGQRERTFDPALFRTLGTKLAQHARVPVVPICVASDFLRIGKWHRDLATVHTRSPLRLACGEPIPFDLPPAEVQRRQIDFMTSTLARWEALDGRKLLAAPLAPPAGAC
ncbi:MAG: 1-acyl-sn-glycerol-3-phosphate acyltransferase [Kiritimatiellae bacterium]|nr:1-acyl-sn-glycerol-3-phosphate acyltransferase [Kiritimatiellia bacterium]